MSSTLDIMHVAAPANFGGLERVLLGLAEGQVGKGHRVRTVALLESGKPRPPLVSDLQSAGVEVITMTHPARSFRAQRAGLRAICNRFKPDIMHTHGYLPDVLAASLGRRTPFGRVTTVHGFTGGTLRNRAYEWMQRRAYSRFEAVVAVSGKLSEEIGRSRRLNPRVHSIPNAWGSDSQPESPESARAALGLPEGRFTVGWIGRISREKGLDVFIDSLPLLKDIAINAVVIGNGPEMTQLQERATGLGLDGRITWMGERRDAASVLPAFDLVVISSRTEGTPMILFEAMHAGVPVIASAVGGIPIVVSENEAVLVAPDNPAILAIGIRTAHNSRAERTARANRARARLAKDFAVAPWLEVYDGLYRNVLSGLRSR